MPRYKLGQAPADASIRNGKYRKTVDIPVEYLDALNALAKADNRDLKNYFETEIIKLAVAYNLALGSGRLAPNNGKEDTGKDKAKSTPGLTIKSNPENANTGPSISNFLDKRRQGKGIK